MFRHEQIQSYLLYTPFVYSHVICVSFALGFCELKMHVRTGHLYNVTCARYVSIYTSRLWCPPQWPILATPHTERDRIVYLVDIRCWWTHIPVWSLKVTASFERHATSVHYRNTTAHITIYRVILIGSYLYPYTRVIISDVRVLCNWTKITRITLSDTRFRVLTTGYNIIKATIPSL